MTYDVLGVGNALVDIQAKVTDEVLETLGFSKGMMTLVDEPTQHNVLRSVDGQPLNRCAGGSAANTIMGVADFGGTAAYVGKVGHDTLGDFCLADMRQLGVTIEVPPVVGHLSPEGTVTVSGISTPFASVESVTVTPSFIAGRTKLTIPLAWGFPSTI